MLTIREAELRDVPAIYELVDHYARQRVLLARTLTEIYESVREFVVAEDDAVQILGCGALKFYSAELGEIRSLCVRAGVKQRGVGRSLVERLLDQADQYSLKTVFALTLVTDFFEKCGFRPADREKFPQKVWRDCLRCEKYFRCNERTVAIELRPAAVEAEQVEGSRVTA